MLWAGLDQPDAERLEHRDGRGAGECDIGHKSLLVNNLALAGRVWIAVTL